MDKLVFTKEALLDFEDIILWYEEQRKGLSFDLELCLDAGISEIVRSPDNFQKRYGNVKIRFISRFPYGIHYITKDDTIFIIGIFHMSRAPKNWTKRV